MHEEKEPEDSEYVNRQVLSEIQYFMKIHISHFPSASEQTKGELLRLS